MRLSMLAKRFTLGSLLTLILLLLVMSCASGGLEGIDSAGDQDAEVSDQPGGDEDAPSDGDDDTATDADSDQDISDTDEDPADLDADGDSDTAYDVDFRDASMWSLNQLIAEIDISENGMEAEMFAEPIPAGTTIHSMLGSDEDLNVNSLSWLIAIDEAPSAMLAHPYRWVLLPADGSTGSFHNASAPPVFDSSEDDIPMRGLVSASHNSYGAPQDPPLVGRKAAGESYRDYGDAPSGQIAYWPSMDGGFPVHEYDDGARTLSCDALYLGRGCTIEAGPLDFADPDGEANLVDRDSDDGVFWLAMPSADGYTHKLAVVVGVADDDTAPEMQYINVLADIDRDGEWQDANEWLVQDYELTLPPNTRQHVEIFDVTIPADAAAACGGMWVRVLLSDMKIDAEQWTGTGTYPEGEVEDLYVRGCDEVTPPAEWEEEVPPDGDSDGDVGDPDDTVCDIDIKRHALILRGADKEGESIVRFSAAYMNATLKDMGYDSTMLRFPQNDQEIWDLIDDFAGRLKCLDEAFVYIIAHGAESDGQGTGEMSLTRLAQSSPATGKTSATDLFAHLFGAVAACDGGRKEEGTCQAPDSACRMTVVVESCFSGSQVAALAGRNLDGRTVILSSQADKPSWTASGVGHVAQALRWAADNKVAVDTNQDGFVSAEELAAIVHQRVLKTSGDRHQETEHRKGAEANCPCDCCGDGTVQSTQQLVNGVLQPATTEECERPGDACTTQGGEGGTCSDACTCGAGSDGDVTDGDVTDGDVTDGDVTDGDVTDGDCDCSLGPCCNNCALSPTTVVCDFNYDHEFGCSGDCGGTVMDRTARRYCSGAASGCEGRIEWTDWTQQETCLETETCDSETGSCINNNECGCVCETGACCDGCQYRNTATICNADINTEHRCAGTCGGELSLRKLSTHCSGASELCNGDDVWGNWQVQQTCESTLLCDADLATCVTDNACACPCPSGECCADCKYLDGSVICDENVNEEYMCSNTECGGSLLHRTADRHCPGNGAGCTGAVTWLDWSVAQECTATQRCSNDFDTCVSDPTCGCDCSSGECCDGCNYRPSNVTCDADAGHEYRCLGDGCGDRVQSRTATRACSGTSDACDGDLVWSSWTDILACNPLESCNAVSGTCQTNPACSTCECSSGSCCDGCNYKADSVICQTDADSQYVCTDGTAPGSDVYVQRRDRLCPGNSDGCTGGYGDWKDPVVADQCDPNEYCQPGSSTCQGGGGCAEGPCCDTASGNYKPSFIVCATAVETDYYCRDGSTPGSDVFARTKDQYCSGSSSACDGALTAWNAPTVADDCTAGEVCVAGNAECQTCVCTTGSCCDGCNYKAGGEVCEENVEVEYGCPEGTDPESSVFRRAKSRLCTGGSSSCDGVLSDWSDWQYQYTCTAGSYCVPGQANCGNCPCTTGSCCDGCNVYDSTHVCESGVEYEKRCVDHSCGGSVERRPLNRKCDGSNTLCTGDYEPAGDWQSFEQCGSMESCRDDTQTCEGSISCGCECEAGECCDGCSLVTDTSQQCGENIVSTTCETQTCGGNMIHTVQPVYCDGTNALCRDSGNIGANQQRLEACPDTAKCECEEREGSTYCGCTYSHPDCQ